MIRRALAAAALAAAVPAQHAEGVLAALTDEQKAAQLISQWTLSTAPAEHLAKVRGWVDGGIGGMILSIGTTADAAALVAELQERATVGLLIAGDFEAGVAFRLRGATEFGCNMLLGATGSARLAREAGRITGVEGRALGFHQAYAPVVDVNVNPHNPIINVRSFGADPAAVARLGTAFALGLQDGGLIATLKHFPGHGDVASDSHLTMPTVPGDRARLDAVELVPFRAAIEAGAMSVMTGHLSVPGLGEDPAVPATLSAKILGGVLRGELGFDGLVVTDALDMGGVREKIAPEEATVRALLAGADGLLMPPDPLAARDAVVAALNAGRVPRARFDEAVLRMLRSKERFGLLDPGPHGPAADWRAKVGTAAHRAVAREVAARGLTLVRDRAGLLPLRGANPTLLTLLDRDEPDTGERFASALHWLGDGGALRRHRVHPGSAPDALAAAAAACADADPLVVALHVKVRSYSGRIGLPPAFAGLAAAVDASRPAVVVSFGNPYLIAATPAVPAYLCAYASTPWTELAAAEALHGLRGITGRVPVPIPGVCDAGAGLTLLPPAEAPAVALPRTDPAAEDLAPSLRDDVRALLEEARRSQVFPGAVAAIARRGRVVCEVAVGRHTYADDAPPTTLDARFDLASLTKVCATTPAVLALVADGALGLDAPVHSLVPAFTGGDKDRVTIRHLLVHASGLPAYVRFFLDIAGKERIVEAAATTPLEAAPGERYRYSDLGLILLMACVERVTGEPFERVVQERVLDPLGMRTATFARSGARILAVPTENCPWRGRVVQGEVHDENAFAMGGVSGHAGLFATAEDVVRLGVAFLSGGRGLAPAPLVREFTRRQDLVEGSTRALGWDTFHSGSSCGTKLSARAFGHTGFTGTSIWCDPATDLVIVLLTNRVHPTRETKGITAVRGALADLVVDRLR